MQRDEIMKIDAASIAFEKVIKERNRQDKMWGEQNHDAGTWLLILMEEVGEWCEAELARRFKLEGIHPARLELDCRTEAVQVAAVGLAIIECMIRNGGTLPVPEQVTREQEPEGSAKQLGPQKQTSRGFPIIQFKDYYDEPCSLQASSLALCEQPGASAVWLGRHGAPRDASMHLSRDQVEALVGHLQTWLDRGDGQFVDEGE